MKKLIDDLEVRDIALHESEPLDVLQYMRLNSVIGGYSIYHVNNLNQAVTLKYYGSPDSNNWFQIGKDKLIPASGGKGYNVFNEGHFWIKASIQCTVAPATGGFKLFLGAM
jgi:hypothetical protein